MSPGWLVPGVVDWPGCVGAGVVVPGVVGAGAVVPGWAGMLCSGAGDVAVVPGVIG